MVDQLALTLYRSLQFIALMHRYRIGETFVHMPLARALKRMEADSAALEAEMAKADDGVEECEKGMKELKLILYAKFGSAINLEE